MRGISWRIRTATQSFLRKESPSLYAFGHHRPDRVKINKGPADICKQHHNFEQNNEYFLEEIRMLKLGLSPVAMTVAASVQAKTPVYCSEGSPEGFNPQFFTSGTTYDASSVPIYNRLVEFKPVRRKLFQTC